MRFFLLLLGALPVLGSVPAPELYFGHSLGEDRKLVQWTDVVGYFHELEKNSDSIRIVELGSTTEGRPLILATIANPQTLEKIERYRQVLARLADPRTTSPEAASALILEGKPVVLITCSIHSTEVASTLTSMQFAYELLSGDLPSHQEILDNTIFLLVPSLNPDGVDKVYSWYHRWLGTPYEGARMIELYHKYLGHDNNRDWYIFSQQETRLMVEKVHNFWHPQIVYDVHQMGSYGARIFVPPWIDPVDPNIDPLIVQQANAFGTAMAVDLTAAGKKGVLVHGIYDYFSPARHYQSYHGGLRLLSESASARLASPLDVPYESLKQTGRNYSPRKRSWNYLEPWEGGVWRLQDIIDNQMITFGSVLRNAALRRHELLQNFYTIGLRVIERGRERFFVIPIKQHDPGAAIRLLQTLHFGAVEIAQALESTILNDHGISEGDYIVRLDQPFGSFAKTLMENQEYPALRMYQDGPPKSPYDVTAHSLPMLMGVETFEFEGKFEAQTRLLQEVKAAAGKVDNSPFLTFSPNDSASWVSVSRLLMANANVYRSRTDGSFLVESEESQQELLQEIAQELGLRFGSSEPPGPDHFSMKIPRVAIYAGHVPNIDEGWTRWLFDQYEIPYESVGNVAVKRGLSGEFDVLILPDSKPEVLDTGFEIDNESDDWIVPPQYRGGLGTSGANALREFVASGGIILAFNRAAVYVEDRFGLPVEDVVGNLNSSSFYGPGTLVNVDVDVTHPLCYGMRLRETVWFESGPAYRVLRRAGTGVKQLLRYPQSSILASGWLLGENYLANRAAVVDVPLGKGHVILFGIRPQYRGQSNATFKMVFNSLFL